MKKIKFLPLNSLIIITIVMLGALFLFLFESECKDFELFGAALLILASLAPVLIAEIIGVIIREKKHKLYADNIAVLIVVLICAALLGVIVVFDMTSTGTWAGLVGMLILIYWMPVYAASLIINLIFFLIKRSKAKKDASFGAQAE